MADAQGALFSEEPTYTVGDVVGRLTRAVASAFPAEVWVRGEVDGLRPPTAKGHTYLSLCERASRRGPTTTLEAVLLSADRRRVERTLADYPELRLASGLEVRVRGRVSFRFGRVRLLISDIDPVHTLGRLAAARDRVVRSLAAEGLLGANGELAIPTAPLRIGVVTSAGSAACEDVLHELTASGFGFRILLADARVQGADAEASLLRALAHLRTRRPDVVLVVRGGGSRSDLATFDGERLARAIAGFPVPVVTGVGHEIDDSVADLVAHTACKTPTAAAALVVEAVRAALVRADRAWDGVARRASVDAAAADDRLAGRSADLVRRSGAALNGAQLRLDSFTGRAATSSRVALSRAGTRTEDLARRVTVERLGPRLRRLDDTLDDIATRAARAARRATAGAESVLAVHEARVAAADPSRLLAQGWSLTRTGDGRLVRRAEDAPPGTTLVTTLADGTVTSTVDRTPPPTDPPNDGTQP